jgi:hypothetical protein
MMQMPTLTHIFVYHDQDTYEEQVKRPHSRAFGPIFGTGNAVHALWNAQSVEDS